MSFGIIAAMENAENEVGADQNEVEAAQTETEVVRAEAEINEDVVVPRSKVPELVSSIEEIGRRNSTFVANFGHAGDGNIHVNFVVDRDDPQQIARARKCVAETFQLSVDLGGTISGEHGIGYVKSPYMGFALDAATIDIMKAIKNAFDPNGILNPGKMFVSRDG